MEEFELVLVVIGVLGDADGIYLVILSSDQTHRALNLEGAFQAEGMPFFSQKFCSSLP